MLVLEIFIVVCLWYVINYFSRKVNQILIWISTPLKFLPCFSKILLIHFLPFKNSLSTNYSLRCLSNNLLKSLYSSSSLEKLCSSPLKISSRQWRLRRIKRWSPPESFPRRTFLEENQEKTSRRSNPLIPLSPIFYYFQSLTLDIPKSFVIKS